MKEKAPEPGRHRTLAEAQEYLMARRAALRLAREGTNETPPSCDPADPPCPEAHEAEQCLSIHKMAEAVHRLPDHLGWGSAAQTAVLRAAAGRRQENHKTNDKFDLSRLEALRPKQNALPSAETAPTLSTKGVISLAPSLGLAILRHKQAASSRLWLLLRAIDTNGRGTITLDLARKAFTDTESPLRFCGQRQLRNLLTAGAGLFWEVDDKQIWLRSAVRVAQTLGVAHFRGQDVAIPVVALTGGIGAVRANLFASFHSGRACKPIARQTLAHKSGVAERTQRLYDRLCGVGKQANYARGPKLGSLEAQEQAWQQGPASFAWRETRKHQDGDSGRYLAWQLPNSYHGPHARLGRGRQKRQNKALADLLTKGTAGNDHSQIDDLNARYFADARAASGAYGRTSSSVYWPSTNPGLWHCLWLPAPEQSPTAARRGDEKGQ